MHIHYARTFKKMYQKLGVRLRNKADLRLVLFMASPFHPLLQNHPLTGKYEGSRSIDVTGDIRIVYRERGRNLISLEAVGTHHELYGS